jgi:membrane protein implicated in regulation of membrane protease activity
MDDWVAWLVACVVLAVGEIATTSFFLGPFAVGALLAAIAALIGAPAAVAWGLFIVGTVLSFALVRPVARRHLQQGPAERTGTAALIGRTAIVLDEVTGDEGSGSVKLEGETWTARSYDEDRVFAAGTRVQVVQIRGATAYVDEL